VSSCAGAFKLHLRWRSGRAAARPVPVSRWGEIRHRNDRDEDEDEGTIAFTDRQIWPRGMWSAGCRSAGSYARRGLNVVTITSSHGQCEGPASPPARGAVGGTGQINQRHVCQPSEGRVPSDASIRTAKAAPADARALGCRRSRRRTSRPGDDRQVENWHHSEGEEEFSALPV